MTAWGSAADRREAGTVLAGATVLAALYSVVAARIDVTPSALEFIGTATGLANVWLVRKQNILSWPIGVVMVVAIGTVLYGYGLMGQAWLHLLYFFPLQFWGWYHWGTGGQDNGELGLSWTPRWEWLVYVPLFGLTTWAIGSFFEAAHDQATLVYWDASVVSASVIALFLQSRKKVESWFLWIGPVNVSAIALYALTGATMFAALYLVFLANAVAGALEWARDARSTPAAGV